MGLLSTLDRYFPDEQIVGLLQGAGLLGGRHAPVSPYAVPPVEMHPLPPPGAAAAQPNTSLTGNPAPGPVSADPGRIGAPPARRGGLGGLLGDLGAIGTGYIHNLRQGVDLESQLGDRIAEATKAKRDLADMFGGAMMAGQGPQAQPQGLNVSWDEQGPRVMPPSPSAPMIGLPSMADAAPRLARAQAAGVNVAPYLQLLQQGRAAQEENQWLAGVPEADRPLARMDPRGYIAEERQSKIPLIINPGNGAVVAIDRTTGAPREVYRAPKQPTFGWEDDGRGHIVPTPGGPYDINYLRERSAATRADPRERARTPAVILGEIEDKMVRGDPLSPNEQRLYDDAHRSSGGFLSGLGLSDYGDEGDAPANPAPRAPAAKAPPIKTPPPQVAAAPKDLPEGAIVRQGNQRYQKRNGQMVPVK